MLLYLFLSSLIGRELASAEGSGAFIWIHCIHTRIINQRHHHDIITHVKLPLEEELSVLVKLVHMFSEDVDGDGLTGDQL